MLPIILLSTFAILCTCLWYLLWVWRVRAVTHDRLSDRVLVLDEADDRKLAVRPAVERYVLIPWLLAIILCIVLVGLDLPGLYAFCFTLIFLLVALHFEESIYNRRVAKLEQQLSDAIDLMVSGLQAGATVTAALESAAREARKPIKAILEEAIGRIHYGDDPQTVLRVLYERAPTENFRLFVTSLSVHWEVGGSLAPVLASVGRSIRDRLDVSRRQRAVVAQAWFSAIVIIAITYSIAWIMWRFNPGNFMAFVGSKTGHYLVAAGLLLQALGVYLLSRFSRVSPSSRKGLMELST